MPGINTLGTAQPDDYNLGRGTVYFATLVNDVPQGYRDLGNATEFNVTVESETLEHQSSRAGLKVVDKEVLISQKLSLSVTLDEINFQNVALFMSGATASHANPAGAAEVTIAKEYNSGTGFWYDIVHTDGERIYDVASLAFNATDHGKVGTEGTDFILDKAMGRFFLPTTTTLTNLDAGTDTIKYTPTKAGGAPASVDEVRALTQTAVAGALKFVSENPAAGDHRTEYEFHKVSLKAEGDFGLISDEFTTMTLTGAAEKNETSGGTASPTLTIRTFDGGASQ